MPNYPLKWITDHLAVGYSPKSYNDLDFIKAQGVGAILNLCAECYDLHEIEEKAGFEVLYLPVADESAPSMEDMETVLAWVDEAIQGGKKVLVHCRFGIGRTGTLVIAYFLKKGLNLDEALEKVEHTPSFPQSDNQWRLLERYGEKVGLRQVKEIADIKKEEIAGSGSFFKRWNRMWDWLTE